MLPPQEHSSLSGENRKPAAGDDGSRVLERKYIENLQQQVYYLELELKHLRMSGNPGATKFSAPDLEATQRSGEGGTVASLREQLSILERRAESLREEGLQAAIGAKLEKDERLKLVEQLKRDAEHHAAQREELTAEAVGYQRELEKSYLVEKTLRWKIVGGGECGTLRWW